MNMCNELLCYSCIKFSGSFPTENCSCGQSRFTAPPTLQPKARRPQQGRQAA
jgi:hypothetical protein